MLATLIAVSIGLHNLGGVGHRRYVAGGLGAGHWVRTRGRLVEPLVLVGFVAGLAAMYLTAILDVA